MQFCKQFWRVFVIFLSLLGPLSSSHAQTLTLSPNAGGAAGTLSFNVNLNNGGKSLAGVEWSWTLPGASNVTINPNLSLGPINKTLNCNQNSGNYICKIDCLMERQIPNVQIATVTLTAAASVTVASSGVTGVDPIGTAVREQPHPLVRSAPATVTSVQCNPAALLPPAVSNCTVALSGASAGILTVALTTDNPLLQLPASVPVGLGVTSVSFTVQGVEPVSSNQVAHVSASLNGSSAMEALGIKAPVPTSRFYLQGDQTDNKCSE